MWALAGERGGKSFVEPMAGLVVGDGSVRPSLPRTATLRSHQRHLVNLAGSSNSCPDDRSVALIDGFSFRFQCPQYPDFRIGIAADLMAYRIGDEPAVFPGADRDGAFWMSEQILEFMPGPAGEKATGCRGGTKGVEAMRVFEMRARQQIDLELFQLDTPGRTPSG